ncbi:MAG: isochorismatase family protein [Acidobacteriota bacterium]
MSRLFFADIDTQKDFMLPEGALYVPGAERIRPKLRRLFQFAQKNNIQIISSVDAHSADDPEFSQFPPHCISGTEGQKKLEETLVHRPLFLENRPKDRNLVEDVRKYSQIVIEKQALDIFSNPVAEKLLRVLPSRAIVFGVATEFCVKFACLGLRRNNVHTVLVTDAIAALSAKTEKEAMDEMREAGVEFIKSDALLEAGSR